MAEHCKIYLTSSRNFLLQIFSFLKRFKTEAIFVQDVGDLLDHDSSDLSDKLSRIGDGIVLKLVEWTRRLPFYKEIPVELHTRLLTNKWHELLLLTTSAYQAIYGTQKLGTTRADGSTAKLDQEVSSNLVILQTCLTSMMGRPITMD